MEIFTFRFSQAFSFQLHPQSLKTGRSRPIKGYNDEDFCKVI